MNENMVTRSKKDILIDILGFCGIRVNSDTVPSVATAITFSRDELGNLQFHLNNQYTSIQCSCNVAHGTVYFKPKESADDGVESCGIKDYKFTLSGSGSTYSLGYVAICMNKIGSYLFDSKQLDHINNSEDVHLLDTIKIVEGPAKDSNGVEIAVDSATMNAYSQVEDEYKTSTSNGVLSADILNSIGVNKISVPRYKIFEGDNECHFEGLSFPANRKNKEADLSWKDSGQFCHDNEMLLANGSSEDSPY